jgi:hypothetical protein
MDLPLVSKSDHFEWEDLSERVEVLYFPSLGYWLIFLVFPLRLLMVLDSALVVMLR